MRATVVVKDARTRDGLNYRTKIVDSLEDAKKFALSCKNRIYKNSVLVTVNGQAKRYSLKEDK